MQTQLKECSYSSWFFTFEKHTFRSKIIPLDPSLVEYFLADSVFLPDPDEVYPVRDREEGSSSGDDWSDSGQTVSSSGNDKTPSFPGLESDINAAIESLGGRVVPRLNWSCPKDAAWVSPSRSLACSTANEVLLLLKSSDRAAHDLSDAWDEAAAADGLQAEAPGCPQPSLVLREYFDLRPEMEFRCFVCGSWLAGISQRDVTQCFSELQGREREVADAITAFHEGHVRGRFPLDDYTMDVYLTKRMRVLIVDFNPAGGTTQPLLFEWDELPYGRGALEGAGDGARPGVEVRFVTEPSGIRPGPQALYGAPHDLVDVSEGGPIDELVRRMQAAGAGPTEG
mmetsp:Transcript_2192/g.5178  ORF Transcript_2192/g.5178 Transcript_2192/m.5178 type:complete len:340 (-) Transcript_2192:13-1032(-)